MKDCQFLVKLRFGKMPASSKSNKFCEDNENKSNDSISVKMEVLKLDNNGEVDEFLDPYCLENKPHKITFQDVTSAAFLIKGGVEKTPCLVSTFCSCSARIMIPYVY